MRSNDTSSHLYFVRRGMNTGNNDVLREWYFWNHEYYNNKMEDGSQYYRAIDSICKSGILKFCWRPSVVQMRYGRAGVDGVEHRSRFPKKGILTRRQDDK